ncbi:hypothetical protein I7G59_06385 [Sinorhizobium meliloti]|uniref:hypothetical protein n=1 Tax=Rhizobium meliloti TaxID=382 RepID=UPI00237FE8BC|nr:hypothetical protein [Sinorhizobium meliloti]MDE3796961.1 hypothetical protein [Sinorhizobium meliloti]
MTKPVYMIAHGSAAVQAARIIAAVAREREEKAAIDGWKPIYGFVDPPPAPEGYETEVERDCFLGLVISYRYIPVHPTAAP